MNETRHVATEPPVLAPGPAISPRQSSSQLNAAGSSRSAILRVRPPKKRWPLVAALIGIAAVIVTLVIVTSPGQDEVKITRPETLKVERRAFSTVLHEMGTIEALVETPVLARVSGDIVWKTDDGKPVGPGEPVVRFETKNMLDDIESREKDLFDKQEAVRRAERTIKMTTERYTHVIRQAEIQLELAEIERKVIFDSPTPDEKLDAELTLKSATLDLNKAEVEMKDHEGLARMGYVSEATRKKKELELATTKVNHSKAKVLYDLTLMGFTPDSKRVAELAVADAKKRLNIVKFNRDADLAVQHSELELANVNLQNFERDLARKKQELEWATVRAPTKGNVVFIDVYKGRSNKSPIQVGENRSAGGDLCVVCDTSTLRVQVWINESDIKSLEKGQKATIKLPAFPGRTYEAVVSDMAVMAMDKNMALSSLALRKSGEAFVNVVQAKLDFINLTDEDRRTIKMGFTADVYLHVTEKNETLTVPWEAVRYDAQGTPYADVVSGSSRERRTLKLGRSDSDRVEVLEGLKAGEQVLDQTLAMFAGGPR